MQHIISESCQIIQKFQILQIQDEFLAVLNDVKDPETRHGSASDLRHMSAQTVFSVLDHLTKWKREKFSILSVEAANLKARGKTVNFGRLHQSVLLPFMHGVLCIFDDFFSKFLIPVTC